MKVLAFTDAPTFPTGVGHQLHNIIKYGFAATDRWVVVHPPRSPRAGETKNVVIGNTPVKLINSTQGYADDPAFVMKVVEDENPDVLVIFTDPWAYHPFMQQLSYWIIERNLPLVYYHVWDNFPAPLYNIPFWHTCNEVIGISMKSTINVQLAKEYVEAYEITMYRDPEVFYLPHAVEPNVFKRMDRKKAREFVRGLVGDRMFDGSVIWLYNNRNISRKNLMDTIYAFLVYMLKNYRKHHLLIIKSDPVVPVGTDIPAFLADINSFFHYRDIDLREHIVFISNDEVFHNGGFSREEIALLYNGADVVLQLSSNEGFGIASLEASLCGTPVVATMTGGIADQYSLYEMDYEVADGSDEDIICKIYEEVHRQVLNQYLDMLRQNGKDPESAPRKNHMMRMVKPYRHYQGSPATPYILDDRVPIRDVFPKFDEALALRNREDYEKLYEESVEYITMHFDVEVLGKEFKKSLSRAIKNNQQTTRQVVVL
jgi:glycosyltransferase involved in cell wall biosynthesis